jgi:hypothetical protein
MLRARQVSSQHTLQSQMCLVCKREQLRGKDQGKKRTRDKGTRKRGTEEKRGRNSTGDLKKYFQLTKHIVRFFRPYEKNSPKSRSGDFQLGFTQQIEGR